MGTGVGYGLPGLHCFPRRALLHKTSQNFWNTPTTVTCQAVPVVSNPIIPTEDKPDECIASRPTSHRAVRAFPCPSIIPSMSLNLRHTSGMLLAMGPISTSQWELLASTSGRMLFNQHEPETSTLTTAESPPPSHRASQTMPWPTAQRSSQAVAIAQSLSLHMHARSPTPRVSPPRGGGQTPNANTLPSLHQQQLVNGTGATY
jgi:hypothetical protein